MVNLKRVKVYVFSILIPLAVGGLAALITKNSMEIYDHLEKSALAPPSVVFPIVWSVLYVLMGISSAIVYLSDDSGKKSALILYAVQLAVNFFWPVFFFKFQMYTLSFFWLLLLIVLVAVMIKKFYDIKPIAGLLQIPYLLWCIFAAYLNFTVI